MNLEKLFKVHISLQSAIGIGLLIIFFSCNTILDDDEILEADIQRITTYADSLGLEGSFSSSNVFVAILDTGLADTFYIDTLRLDVTQTDTMLLIDTVLVDTILIDTLVVIDTFSTDTPALDTFTLDTFRIETFPRGTDTVSVRAMGQTLAGNIFLEADTITLSDGSYPTLGQLIPGVEVGISALRVTGRAILLIPSDEAYGRSGNGTLVPPNSPIRMDVQLLSIESN
ncbi:MAG: FKBP-type peptidyl-prolyl cis-trans isomerase [Bacteroidota bacterium]